MGNKMGDKKSSFCEILGHSKGCSAQHPLHNSHTAKISTVIKPDTRQSMLYMTTEEFVVLSRFSLSSTFVYSSGVRALSKCKYGRIPAQKPQH